MLAARAELPVIAAVALGARHVAGISTTLAIRDDLPEWLRVAALAAARCGGPTIRRTCWRRTRMT
jgi:endonuclease V-like protein UPF0215 family